ncbi:MAG: VWA domain-containing protein [Ruminiclostridium sp.]|nr:VWA domain-containing protein [Ruminiclostridium sp.]
MKKKLITLLLISALIASAASCGQNGGTDAPATGETTAAPETTTAEAATAEITTTGSETAASETTKPVPETEKTTEETTEKPGETTPETTSGTTSDTTAETTTSEAYIPETTAAPVTEAATEAPSTTAEAMTTIPAPFPGRDEEAYDDDEMGYYDLEDTYFEPALALDGAAGAEAPSGSYKSSDYSADESFFGDWIDDDIIPPVYEPVQARAGLLTAGEWRDNGNYAFWKSLFGQRDDWKELMDEWGVSTLRRVAVRVTDKNGAPASGLTVKLMSGSSELWRAVTDSRGEAFLFAGLGLNGEAPDKVTVSSPSGDVSAKVPENYTETDKAIELEVGKEAAMRMQLDLMFMIDTTGSMGDELTYLQKELEDVIKRVNDATQADIQLSVNFYRDEGDEYVVRPFEFTSDINTALKQLSAQCSDGGGDYPEAVIKALDNAVNDHQWRSDSEKLMFLVLDAPPHLDDGKQNYARLVKAFAEKGIRVIPVASSGVDTATEYLLRSIALGTGGTYTFLTNDSGIGNSHLEPTIGKYEVEKLNDLLVRVISDYFSRETRKAAEAPKPSTDSGNNSKLPEGAYEAEWCKTSDYYSGEGMYTTQYIRSEDGLARFFKDYGDISGLAEFAKKVDLKKNVIAVKIVMLSSGSISIDKSSPFYASVEDGSVEFTYTLDIPEVGTADMAAIFIYAAIPADKVDIPFTDKQLKNMETVDNEISQMLAELKNKSPDEKKKAVAALLGELADKGLILKDSIYFADDMYSFTYDLGDYGSVGGEVSLK